MSFVDAMPAINAVLNGASLLCLVGGVVAVKRGDRELHRKLMVAAFTLSAVFLVVYLSRWALVGTHRFPGTGWRKGLYLAILFSHMPLAALVLPLSVRAVFLAWKQRFAEHRRVTRWLWPIWTYVSVTGVLVYLMLHHWHGA